MKVLNTIQSAMKHLVNASRLSKIHRGPTRIIVRPTRWLDVKKVGTIRLAVDEDADEDIICPNAAQNILVVSTPARKHACAHAAIQQIRISECTYDVAAFLAASDN